MRALFWQLPYFLRLFGLLTTKSYMEQSEVKHFSLQNLNTWNTDNEETKSYRPKLEKDFQNTLRPMSVSLPPQWSSTEHHTVQPCPTLRS